ncbi:unnamed protein product [Vitrella brassicaformis CCMP3155]|uniref:PAS fold-3 domain-containing protein n=3 Tax=Vitrella brassicaformis TaxID=1169539 RepID=A0A0G4GKV2_VITBC|nr:unnamed protein product [Vitrella brassicaformis CCMP3155]|eukprot:CEM30656.1 unnamed protein product [Vitrella brassicaformis CCMP3155]
MQALIIGDEAPRGLLRARRPISSFFAWSRDQWQTIGCESKWRWPPFLRVQYSDPVLEEQYRRLMYEDLRETAKALGFLGLLAILLSILVGVFTEHHGDDLCIDVIARAVFTVPFALFPFLYALLDKPLVGLYCWYHKRYHNKNALTDDGLTDAYCRVERFVLALIFIVSIALIHMDGRITYHHDWGYVWSSKEDYYIVYRSAHWTPVCAVVAGWMAFKCDSFLTLLMHVTHVSAFAVFELLCKLPGNWRGIIPYAIVNALFYIGSRQIELFTRTTLYQKNQVHKEKESKKLLLESFSQLVGIAAWEWDTSAPIDKGCYQTKVIEHLTGRRLPDSSYPADSSLLNPSPSFKADQLPQEPSSEQPSIESTTTTTPIAEKRHFMFGYLKSAVSSLWACCPSRRGSRPHVSPSDAVDKPAQDQDTAALTDVPIQIDDDTKSVLSGCWTEHVIIEDRHKIQDAILRCAKQGASFEMDIKYERADGQVRWFRCGGRKKTSSDVICGFIQDVTDTRRQAKAQEKRVSLLQRVADAILDATAVVDIQEELFLESSSLLNLWQRRPLEGTSLTDVIEPDMVQCLKRDVVLRAGLRLKCTIKRKQDGQQAHGELLALTDEDDPASVFLGFQDMRSTVPPYLSLRTLINTPATRPPPPRRPPPSLRSLSSTNTTTASTPQSLASIVPKTRSRRPAVNGAAPPPYDDEDEHSAAQRPPSYSSGFSAT